MEGLIHLHPTKTQFSYHVFLLLLPALVFVFVLVFLVAKTSVDRQVATSVDQQPVLGQQAR